MINKLKIEDAGRLTMPAGKFLVEQLKERKHTVKRMIPKPVENEEEAINSIRELEEVKNREPYYIQFYRLISVPEGETEYKVGDIVLAALTAGATFDLIPKTKVINKFDVIAKYSE